MFRLIKNLVENQGLTLDPEDAILGSGDTGEPGEELSTQELVDFLKDDEEEETEILDLKEKKAPKKEPEEDEESEEDEEEKSLEDEIEEELDEEDAESDDDPIITPPSRREILTKYPNLYKDFPHLEKAFYREQKYTEIYPTIKHAEAASEKARVWDNLENDLGQGNLSGILNAVATTDKNAFYKMVDEILPTISSIDKDAGTHIYSGIAKEIYEMMVQAGSKEGQEPLRVAAQLMHQFLFGAKDFEQHKPLAKKIEKDPREDAITKREQQFVRQQFELARDEIGTKINNTLKGTIERNIDPKDSMNDYVKEKAVEDVFKDVQDAIRTDKRFQTIMTRLWDRAVKEQFSNESKQAIRSAILGKAKQLLPSAIQKGRKKAFGGVVKKTADGQKPVKTDLKVRSSATSISGKTDREKARSIPKNMSTKDFLLSD